MFSRLILIFILAFPIISQAAKSKVITGYDLITKSQKQEKLKTDTYKVMLFYSSTCPCSQSHFDHLNNLSKSFKQFQFVGFHSNKAVPDETPKSYFGKLSVNFPIFLDKDLKYANEYKALKTPHVFVLNSQGELVFQGGVTDSRDISRAKKYYLKEVLTALSQGKSSPYKAVRTLGCYITR